MGTLDKFKQFLNVDIVQIIHMYKIENLQLVMQY